MNQSETKSSQRVFLLEQIKQLDQYFYNKGIGRQGELIRYLLENEELLNNSDLMKNGRIVLQYQDSSRFNSIAKRLRCNTIQDYCKYILCASDLENFCNTYTALSQDEKSLDYERDENGVIILKSGDYLTVNAPTTGSGGGRWYLLSNGTEIFIKNVNSMKEAYAELVAEQIAKQMGIPYAQYDFVDINGKKQIASINILEEGEELIPGSDILLDLKVKDIDSICRSLCRFLKTKYPNLTEEDIQKIKEDFLKITIFDKVIANWDRNPGNWGVIILSDGSVKMAHELDNNKALNLRGFYDNFHRDMHLNNDHKIETLLEYCFTTFSNPDQFLDFIENCKKNMNARKACQDIKSEKGISIPNEEILDMDGVVHSRGTQQMRWWIERKKSAPGEDPRL